MFLGVVSGTLVVAFISECIFWMSVTFSRKQTQDPNMMVTAIATHAKETNGDSRSPILAHLKNSPRKLQISA